MAEVGQNPALSPDAVARLRRFASSGRFQLGRRLPACNCSAWPGRPATGSSSARPTSRPSGIRAATTTAARLLRREGEFGVIAPGALADLLVIDGNPLDDIRVLTTPDATLKLIMKDGTIFKNEL